MNERSAARIILFNEHNQVLLLKMKQATSYWLTPGGGKEGQETLFETAQRELFEETNINNAQIQATPQWYSESVLSYKGVPTLFKQHYFLAHVKNAIVSFSNLQHDEQDIQEYRWCSIQELSTLKEIIYPVSLLSMLADFFAHGISACTTIIEV